MRRGLAAIAVAIFTALFTLGSTAPASAETNCNTQVVDEAGVLNGDPEGKIRTAINTLTSIGADVRVRTYRGAPDGVRAKLDEAIGDCRSWQQPAGGQKDNLVVYMLSMDPKDQAIFSGNLWGHLLDGGVSNFIQGSIIAPQFREGRFDLGVANGLTAVYNTVRPGGAPPPGFQPTQVSPDNGGSARGGSGSGGYVPSPTYDSNPTDWGAVGRVVLWILGIVLVIGLTIILVAAFVRHRRNRQQLAAARGRMEEAKSSASSSLNTLIRKLDETSGYLTVLVNVNAPNAAALKQQLDGARTEHSQADSDNVAHLNMVPEALSPEQVDSLTKAFTGIALRATQALSVVNEAAAVIFDFMDRAQKVDTIHPQVRDSIAKAKTSVTATANEGLNVSEATAKLAAADEAYGDAMNALETQQGPQVLAHLDTATTAVAEALALRGALVARRDAINTTVAKQTAQLEEARGALTRGTEAFTEMTQRYAESAWDQLQGNGAAATALIDQAVKDMATVPALVTNQLWEQAESTQAEVERMLTKAISLMQSAVVLRETLQRDELRMQAEIDAAKADLSRAEEYESRYDADVHDSLRDELAEARRFLAEAVRLSGERPVDPQAVVEAATAANTAADGIYTKAAGQVEAAERDRQRAASALTSAETAVANAKEYLEDHDRHVTDAAEEEFRKAKAALVRAQEADQTTTVIREATEAKKLAESALRRVKTRVNRARQAAQASSSTGYTTMPSFPTVNVPSTPSFPSFGGGGGSTHGSSSGWSAPASSGSTHGSSSGW
jgi:hypothetical protein